MQTYLNVHRAEDTRPFDEVALFLPHPVTWTMQTQERTLNVSRGVAIAVIQSITWLDGTVLAAIDPWLRELELIAAGE